MSYFIADHRASAGRQGPAAPNGTLPYCPVDKNIISFLKRITSHIGPTTHRKSKESRVPRATPTVSKFT